MILFCQALLFWQKNNDAFISCASNINIPLLVVACKPYYIKFSNKIMQVDYDIIIDVLLYSAGLFLVYYLCYRRYIYSILDPLFVYVFTLSFSSVLVIFMLADRPEYVVHFFLCHMFFFVGFTAVSYWLRDLKQQVPPVQDPASFFDYITLRRVVYSLFTFYLLANIILFYTTGFALLSDEPTTAKVENFVKGFGIIQKINFSVGSFLTAGFLFLLLTEVRRLDLILFLIVILCTALEGSKSSLLRILTTFALLMHHPLFRHKRQVMSAFKLAAPIGLIAVFGVFFTVLLKENADSEQALFAFVRRLLYGADSILYFYLPVNEQYFARFHFWEYPMHFFDQILGFLRLVIPEEALGNVMVMNAFPDMAGTIVGPNTPYYIEGQIYFGYFGAFIYSIVVGGCYAFIRQYFFHARYFSAFWFVLFCSICHQASALSVEVTLFITLAFDTCFFVVPVYLFMSLAIQGKLIIRKLHF